MELLTTLKAVKEELGIPEDEGSQDNYIERMITAASGAIARYCDRQFARRTVMESVPGRDTPTVYLSLTPIVDIESVEIGGVEVDPGGYTVDHPNEGALRRFGGVWPWSGRMIRFIEAERVAGSEVPNITVTYTGGYILPGDDDRDLPYELELACIMAVSDWVQGQGTPRDAVRLQAEQVSVSFGQSGAGGRMALSTTVRELLDPWKRVI